MSLSQLLVCFSKSKRRVYRFAMIVKYYLIIIIRQLWKLLRVIWRGILYQYNCMPMGFAWAPRLFKQFMKPVYIYFRSNGFDSIAHREGFLLIGSSPTEFSLNVETKIKIFMCFKILYWIWKLCKIYLRLKYKFWISLLFQISWKFTFQKREGLK